MKQKTRIISALALLVLFLLYQTGITAFTHVHYVDGMPVTHSHPFHGTHSHTKASLLAIGQLSAFCSSGAEARELQHPLRPLLCVLRTQPATPTAKGAVNHPLSLRAPPAFLLPVMPETL